MKLDAIGLRGIAAVLLAATSLVFTSLAQQAPPPPAGGAPAQAQGGRGGRGGREAAAAAMQEKIKEAAALPTPRTPDGHPDLSGFWTAGGFNGGGVFNEGKAVTPDGKTTRPIAGSENEEIAGDTANVSRRKADTSLRPTYKPQFVATAANNFDKAAHLDPSYKCQPDGVPRIGAPTEIFQRPDSVAFLYQSGANNNTFRVIPTNNPPHNPDADVMSNGDSVGHWEGDTLIIDVTNINPDTWLDLDGSFHDQNLHVIEKLTRQGNTLRYEVTDEDPTLFAEPFTPKAKILLLGKPAEHAQESYPCQEKDQAYLENDTRH